MINQDSLEAVSDGLVHQLRSDGRINATADSTQNLAFGPNELPDAGDFLLDEICHGPILLRLADIDREVLEQLGAIRGICGSLAMSK